MLIIAGRITVDAAERDDYLRECVAVVEAARRAPGCLDFAITADTVEAGRIDIYERWASEAELDAFRGSGPSQEQSAQILDADVRRYLISAEADA